MALKLNIWPELDEEIEELFPLSGARSKTEYINMAIADLNRRIKRKKEVEALKGYFSDAGYQSDLKQLAVDFAKLRGRSRD